MKFAGKSIEAVALYKVIPKGGMNITFKAIPADLSIIDTLLKEPTPPIKTLKSGVQEFVTTDPEYIAAKNEYTSIRTGWIIANTLRESDIVFECVTDDLASYAGVLPELEATFTIVELNNIMDIVNQSNGISQKHIDAATEDFLAGLEKAKSQ